MTHDDRDGYQVNIQVQVQVSSADHHDDSNRVPSLRGPGSGSDRPSDESDRDRARRRRHGDVTSTQPLSSDGDS